MSGTGRTCAGLLPGGLLTTWLVAGLRPVWLPTGLPATGLRVAGLRVAGLLGTGVLRAVLRPAQRGRQMPVGRPYRPFGPGVAVG